MTTNSAGQRSWQLRFSLRELLIVMLLCAVAIWITSLPLWDFDERLILGSWFVAVCLAIWRGRTKGRRGIGLSALAGGLVPALLYVLYLLWSFLDLMPSNWSTNHWNWDTNLMATGLFGSIAGAVAAAALTPPRLEDAPPTLRGDRLLRRRVLFVGTLIAAVLLVGGWSAYRRSRNWDVRAVDCVSASGLAMSRRGQWLAGYRTPHRSSALNDQAIAEVVHLASTTQARVRLKFEQSIDAMCLSDDGEQLALAFFSDGRPRIELYDCATGRLLSEINVDTAAVESEIAPGITFADSGRELLLRTMIDDGANVVSRIRTFSLAERTVAEQRDYDGACFVLRAAPALRLIRAREHGSGRRWEGVLIALVDWETGKSPRFFGPFDEFHPMTLSEDGIWLAVDHTLIDLRSGDSTVTPAALYGFTSDSRFVFGVEKAEDSRYSTSPWVSPSLRSVVTAAPLVRHLWFRGDHARLVILDVESTHRVASSQWLRGAGLHDVQLSDDSSTLASAGQFDQTLIWKVPPFGDER